MKLCKKEKENGVGLELPQTEYVKTRKEGALRPTPSLSPVVQI